MLAVWCPLLVWLPSQLNAMIPALLGLSSIPPSFAKTAVLATLIQTQAVFLAQPVWPVLLASVQLVAAAAAASVPQAAIALQLQAPAAAAAMQAAIALPRGAPAAAAAPQATSAPVGAHLCSPAPLALGTIRQVLVV